ncbi:hypothetical protein [Microbacterium sp. C7(2022)]|uniref:hypothetical protein n=1 Tax=Microbacterium sp. C7(2022) TaxID=2992759 RepID=UPI00237B6DF9|nr:hypothetical protein [Microbacterium sp. C7(2022)]MDE0546913.1 hypothetical protein [Microbacterium sp. C7(2022)]
MRSPRTGLSLTALVMSAAFVVSGCSLTTPADSTPQSSGATDPTDTSDGSRGGSSRDDEVIECDGRDTTIADSDRDYILRGICPTVSISGNDLDVSVEEAQVGSVIVRGDRNEIEAGDLTALEIEGQSADVEAMSLGSLSIAGDRNDVEIEGILGSVVLNGNDNSIEARELGDVADNGQRNHIRTD